MCVCDTHQQQPAESRMQFSARTGRDSNEHIVSAHIQHLSALYVINLNFTVAIVMLGYMLTQKMIDS